MKDNVVELKTNIKTEAKALVKENPLAWSNLAINAMETAILTNDPVFIRLAKTYEDSIKEDDYSFAGTILKIVMFSLAEDHIRESQEKKSDDVRYF